MQLGALIETLQGFEQVHGPDVEVCVRINDADSDDLSDLSADDVLGEDARIHDQRSFLVEYNGTLVILGDIDLG
jgi:hypothetical protein